MGQGDPGRQDQADGGLIRAESIVYISHYAKPWPGSAMISSAGQNLANDTARRSRNIRWPSPNCEAWREGGQSRCCSERGTNSTTMRSFCASCSPSNSQAQQGPKQRASRAKVGLRGEYLTSSRWYDHFRNALVPLREEF
jgi:hypothetical protein